MAEYCFHFKFSTGEYRGRFKKGMYKNKFEARYEAKKYCQDGVFFEDPVTGGCVYVPGKWIECVELTEVRE